MIKLQMVPPFRVNRVVPPVIMPENPGDRKKYQAFMVLAPSPEQELNFLSNSSLLRFRNLTRYFVPKRWSHTFKGRGVVVSKPNANGEYTALLNQYRRGNLRGIDDVSSFLPSATSRSLMKGYNLLLECNHVTRDIMNNPKDHRPMYLRAQEIFDEWVKIHDSASVNGSDANYLGAYNVDIVIPMNLWFRKADYANPAKIFKRSASNTNLMSYIIQLLMDPINAKHFGRIHFICDDLVMTFDTANYPSAWTKKGRIEEEAHSLFVKFLTKCSDSTDVDDELLSQSSEDEEPKTFDQRVRVIAVDRRAKQLMGKDPEGSMDVTDDEPTAPTIPVQQKTSPTSVYQTRVRQQELQRARDEIIGQRRDESRGRYLDAKTDVVVDTLLKKVGADLDDQETRDAVKNVVLKNVDVGKVPIQRDPVSGDPVAILSHPAFDVDLHSAEDVDALLAAKTAGNSVQSNKRDEMLREKYKELNIGDVPLKDVLEHQAQLKIPESTIPARTVNEDMKTNSFNNFEKAYMQNLFSYDLSRILMHFSHVNPAMYLYKDIQVEDASTPTDRMIRYTVNYEDTSRKRHRFSFLLPKMYNYKYLYLNDQKMNISHQKLPFPVTKVSPDKCQLVSNYNKIFTERYGGNLSPLITKLKKIFGGPEAPNGSIVTKGNSNPLNKNRMTTIEYDDIGSIITQIRMGDRRNDTTIYFIVDEAATVIDQSWIAKAPVRAEMREHGDTADDCFPLAVRHYPNKQVTYYFLSGRSNHVYACGPNQNGDPAGGEDCGELAEFLAELSAEVGIISREMLKETTAGSRFVYSRSKAMNQWIPTVLLCAAADPGGLTAVLEKAQIEFEFVEKKPTLGDEKACIAFADGYLVYNRYPYENSLLLNGLSTFPTKNYSFYDMDTFDAYVQIFDTMFGARYLNEGLRNFYYLFVDPITEDILARLKMPTDFTRLMLYCNDILADNRYQIDSDYHNSRIRSNEIILAHLYYELASAWGKYRTGRAESFSIPENCVIKYLLTANIVDPHSELNIVLELENDRLVKLKGPSGMNEDHSFTIEKRAYHPSMKGLVGMNSVPSGEVGIGRHMVINPNVVDARGFMDLDKKDYSGSQMVTPGEAMQVFSPESSDIERLAMAISQTKHVVPVVDTGSCPISYDMERVIPYYSNDFARTAEKDGTVVSISNDILIIKYDDGTIEDVDLSKRPAKNTDGGFFVMNQMITRLKPGDKVTKGQLIAWDPKYINEKDMFHDPLANLGTMARVAVETNGGVFEDSCFITNKFAHRITTKITRQKRVILSKYANIKHMVKLGQDIGANEALLTFDDTEDAFTSQMLAAMADEAGDEDEVIATNAPVISKISGKVVDIQIFYTADPNEMTPSMRAVIEDYAKRVAKRENSLEKYTSTLDSKTIIHPSERLIPDSNGKVKGVKLPDGIMIDFYIEYEDVASAGDKVSFHSAMKGIISNVIPDELAPYPIDDPEHPIELDVSCIGIYKRMLNDVIKLGLTCNLVIDKKYQLRDKYGSRIKEELAKYRNAK